jgi:hypothetical protein
MLMNHHPSRVTFKERGNHDFGFFGIGGRGALPLGAEPIKRPMAELNQGRGIVIRASLERLPAILLFWSIEKNFRENLVEKFHAKFSLETFSREFI